MPRSDIEISRFRPRTPPPPNSKEFHTTFHLNTCRKPKEGTVGRVRLACYLCSRNVFLQSLLHFANMRIYKVCIPPYPAKYYADTFMMKDIVTGDEIVSDTWEMKEVDSVVYEIDCKMVTKGADRIGQFTSQEKGHQRQHEATMKLTIVLTTILPSRYWGEPIRGRTRGDSRRRNRASTRRPRCLSPSRVRRKKNWTPWVQYKSGVPETIQGYANPYS